MTKHHWMQVPLAALGERDAALIDAAADVCGLRKEFTRNVDGQQTTFGRFLAVAHRALAVLEARAAGNAVARGDVLRRRQLFAQIYAEVTLFVAERLRRGLGASSVWARPLRLVWARRKDQCGSYWPAMLLAYIGSPDPVLPAEPRRETCSVGVRGCPGAGNIQDNETICAERPWHLTTTLNSKMRNIITPTCDHMAARYSPHTYLQSINYERIPGYMRRSLDANLEKMKHFSAPTYPPDVMLVEFFGQHDFAWVRKECVVPFAAHRTPNCKVVRDNNFKAAQHEILEMIKSTDSHVVTVLRKTLETKPLWETPAFDLGLLRKSGPLPMTVAIELWLKRRERALRARWAERGAAIALGDLYWLAWKTADDDDDITEAIGFQPEEGDFDSDNGSTNKSGDKNNNPCDRSRFENSYSYLMHQAAALRGLLVHERMLKKVM